MAELKASATIASVQGNSVKVTGFGLCSNDRLYADPGLQNLSQEQVGVFIGGLERTCAQDQTAGNEIFPHVQNLAIGISTPSADFAGADLYTNVLCKNGKEVTSHLRNDAPREGIQEVFAVLLEAGEAMCSVPSTPTPSRVTRLASRG